MIAVIGATGSQGGAVVRALVDDGAFRVRALTRNPDAYSGPAHEAVRVDLNEPDTLDAAFADAHGVFAVSNFNDSGADEVTQGRRAVDAAVKAGVRHFVWSTLPNVEEIGAGEFDVAHFTNKAKVDPFVRDAGFESFTFVEAPFYFENLLNVMAPQPLPDGRTGWALPISGDAVVIHAGSIADLGGVVAGAFNNPEVVGGGSYLSSAAELTSFAAFAATLESVGRPTAVLEVPPAVYATFYPGAEEMAQMMLFWVSHTYLGANGDEVIAAARQVSTTPSTDFASWAAAHMVSAGS